MTTQREAIAEAIPRWYGIAAAELGVREIPGAPSSSRILEYLATCTQLPAELKANEDTSWCAAFVNWALAQAGVKGTGSAAAISYEKYGTALIAPKLGAIVVLKRDDPNNANARHVGLFVRQATAKSIHLLSGNSANMVRCADYPLADVTAYRWPTGVS